MSDKTRLWYMPLDIDRLLALFVGMSAEERGIYITLFSIYWHQDGLTNDTRELAKLCGLSTRRFNRVAVRIMAMLEEREDGKLFFPYAKGLREEQEKRAEKFQKRASHAARARWKPDATSNASSSAKSTPQAMLEQCHPYPEEEITKSIVTESGSKRPAPAPATKPASRRQKKNPPALAHRLKDYQIEVINKCTGRIGATDHPSAGMFYRIGEQIPSEIVHKALGKMQDKRLDNKNPDRKTINNLLRYYLATVRDMAAEAGVKTSINWKNPKPVEARLDELLDQNPKEAST